MLLLDFPPEIFQRIVQEVVLSAGICPAWQLRKVCRVFASEIYHDVLTHQPLENIVSVSGKFPYTWWPLLLRQRIKSNAAKCNELCITIMAVTEFQLENRDNTKGRPNRAGFLMLLCNMAIKLLHPHNVVRYLADGAPIRTPPLTRSVTPYGGVSLHTVENKLAVATTFGFVASVASLLASVEPINLLRSTIFGVPLDNAVSHGRTTIVGLMAEHMEDPSAQIDSSNCEISTIRVVFSRNIETASRRGKTGILRLLLEFYNGKIGPCEKNDWNTWLHAAVVWGDIDTIRLIVDMPNVRNRRVLLETFHRACEKCHADAVALLLGTDKINLKRYPWVSTYPLQIALDIGRLDIIRTLLDAGASADGSKDKSMDEDTPLQIAIRYEDEAAVALLLERGADVDWCPSGDSPMSIAGLFRDKTIYNMLKSWKDRRNSTDVAPDI
ncbi:ankyrin repeat-containing domain protein [Massariosphaeria phaeospora]|uniref:Ankyrin repeat-containing domain protein n=1 Tax=Massariosphaeria phaeospora TaxID=100035 RepID=A0A7C8IF36_9PLEO|nr:ankyrin repeat-containing domain protein [Massariosphaeria phaeospora]